MESKSLMENPRLKDEESSFEESNDDSKDNASSIFDTDDESKSKDISIDSAIWRKFNLLSSVLRETQVNLREMDNLVQQYNIKSLSDIDQSKCGSNNSLTSPPLQALKNATEPKTDEAKLTEILDLLHHLTKTLSSYEQHPLLTLPNQQPGLPTSQQISDLSSSMLQDFLNLQMQNISPIRNEVTPANDHTLPSRDQQNSSTSGKNFNSKNSFSLLNNETATQFSNYPRQMIGLHDVRSFERANEEEMFTQHNISTSSNQFSFNEKNVNFASCQTEPSLFETHSTESHSYGLGIETRSLRSEIDNVLERKRALDSRFQNLLNQQESIKSKDVLSKYFVTESFESTNQMEDVKDTYIAKVHSDSPDFPSLGMSSSENGNHILELQNVETNILGLGESGLSEEISSINATIQDLIKENRQLHGYLQNLTSQSVARADHDNNVLETKIKSLTEENDLLKRDVQSKSHLGETVDTSSDDCGCSHSKINSSSQKKSSFDFSSKSSFNISQFDDTGFHEEPKLESDDDKERKISPKSEGSKQIFNFNLKINELNEQNKKLTYQLQAEKVLNNEQILSYENTIQKLLDDKLALEDLHLNINNEFVKNENETILINTEKISSVGGIQFSLPESEVNDTLPVNRVLLNEVNFPSSSCSVDPQLEINKFPPPHCPADPQSEIHVDHSICKTLIEELKEKCKNLKDKLIDMEKCSETLITDNEIILRGKYFDSKEKEESLQSKCSSTNEDVLHNKRENKFKLGTNSQEVIIEEEKLRRKVEELTEENKCLLGKVEEMESSFRELNVQIIEAKEEAESTKSELMLLRNEKLELKRQIRSMEETREDSSLSCSDSGNSSRVTQRFKERIRALQSEVELALRDNHECVKERDKVKAEKESLEVTSKISLDAVKEQNDIILSQLRSMKESLNEKHSIIDELQKKISILKNEIDDKSVEEIRLNKELDDSRDIVHQQTIAKNDLEEKLNSALNPAGPSKMQEIKLKNKSSSDVIILQRQLEEERLKAWLSETSDQESTARISLLQRSIRDLSEQNEVLQFKYNKLKLAFKDKKFHRVAYKDKIEKCSNLFERFKGTTNELEENYKEMLSTLGDNIGITVEILSSHVFLSSCIVHPGPDISADASAWFVTQCSRLRWLQTYLRRLCLHNWKTASFPTYSMDAIHQSLPLSNQSEEVKSKEEAIKSYPCSPSKSAKKENQALNKIVSSYKDNIGLSQSCDSSLPIFETKLGDLKSVNAEMSFCGENNCSDNERTIALHQSQLSGLKANQYRDLCRFLQEDKNLYVVPSPSVPSSTLTSPGKHLLSQRNYEFSDSSSSSMKERSTKYLYKTSSHKNAKPKKYTHRTSSSLVKKDGSSISSEDIKKMSKTKIKKEMFQTSEKEQNSCDDSSSYTSNDLIMNFVNQEDDDTI